MVLMSVSMFETAFSLRYLNWLMNMLIFTIYSWSCLWSCSYCAVFAFKSLYCWSLTPACLELAYTRAMFSFFTSSTACFQDTYSFWECYFSMTNYFSWAPIFSVSTATISTWLWILPSSSIFLSFSPSSLLAPTISSSLSTFLETLERLWFYILTFSRWFYSSPLFKFSVLNFSLRSQFSWISFFCSWLNFSFWIFSISWE